MKAAALLKPQPRAIPFLAATIGAILLTGILRVGYDNPVALVGGFLAIVAIVAVVRFPIVAMAGALFLIPFHFTILAALGNKANVDVGPLIYWKDVAIVALLARGLFERVRKDRRLPIHNAGDNLLIFFILALAAIAIASPSRATVGPALGRYVEGPMLVLALRFLRPTRQQLWWCVGAVLAAVTVIGAAAIIEALGPKLEFQRWFGNRPKSSGAPFFLRGNEGYRAGSFLASPFILSFVMAGAAPFVWGLALMRSRWRTVAIVCALACSGGLLAASTRSGYIGGFVGLVVVILLVVRNPAIRVSLLSIVIVIVVTATVYYSSQSGGVLNRPASNTAHRASLERDFDLLAARPFGYGLGTTDHFQLRADAGAGQLGYTESSFMAVALESGVQGASVYVVALFVTAMRLRSVRLRARKAGDGAGVSLAAGAIGAMVGVSLTGMFLGLHELVIEEILWAVPAIALAWPIASRGDADVPSSSGS